MKSIILWLSKLLNVHVLGLHFWCLSSWQEEFALWAGLNYIVDAVAGGRRGHAQGTVALVLFKEEQKPSVKFPPAQSNGGVNWHAGLARGNSFDMYPPYPYLEGPKMCPCKASLKALISDSVKCC